MAPPPHACDVAAVLVIGGGPAGLATAIEARRRGCDVLVVERSRAPIDKPCGEGLMPDGVARLEALGVRLGGEEAYPFRGIRYCDGEVTAEGRFPGGPGLGIRRTVLHRALVERAAAAGVRFRWQTRVRGLTADGVETVAGAIAARWIVAADGLRSPLRRWAGLEGRPARQRRFGVRRHYALAPWADVVEVHWAAGCEAYVTPVAPRQVGVAMLWSGGKATFDDLLGRFPALAARLRGALRVSKDLGAGPLRQRVRGVVRGPVALVGDASGYVDAITGEGLALAFHQASVLGEALAAGNLADYARRHREIGARAEVFTRLLLAIEARPALRRRIVAALAGDGALFSSFLACQCGALPVRRMGGPALALLLRAAHLR